MAEEIKNELYWQIIDKNDDISELIDKLNFNFAQFAAFNGGIPGANGADGANGMITKSRCGIHTISKDDVTTKKTTENADGTTTTEYVNKYTNKEFAYDINEVERYYNDNSNEYEELLDGDIIIYGPCIFKYNDIDDKKGFELISRITGEKGDDGKSSNSDGYFTSFDRSGKGENVNISFSNNKNINGIILEEESKYHGTGIPISNAEEDIFWNYSLLFTKTSTDGLSFFKTIKNKKNILVRYPDTQIKHNIELDSSNITTSSSFEIVDDSLNGSSYISNKSLSLKAINDQKDDASTYGYSIILGENNGLSINSKDNININFGNTIKIFNDKTELLSLNDTELNTNIEKINLDSIVTVKKICYEEKENTTTWSIDDKGDAQFNSIKASEITLLEENRISNISEIFAIKEKGFNQFVTAYASNLNVDEDKAKEKLRNEIGAVAAEDIKINETNNFTINTYSPVGTIIMSMVYTDKYISDEFGGLYVLCDGTLIENGKLITARYYDKSGTMKEKNITIDLKEIGVVSGKSGDSFYVPNLGGRFLVGYDKNDSDYSITNTGGQKKVKLTINELPKHQHKYAGNEEMWGKIKDWSPFEYKQGASRAGSDHGNGCIYYTEPIGQNISHENRPPYYVVSYYLKIQNI